MDVIHGDDQLLEEPARLTLPQPPLAHDILKHVAARRILHRNGQVLLREEDLHGETAAAAGAAGAGGGSMRSEGSEGRCSRRQEPVLLFIKVSKIPAAPGPHTSCSA